MSFSASAADGSGRARTFPDLTLYDGGRAPTPRRVRIFLAEKDLTVPIKPVDLGKLEQRDEAFTALNPYQRTPVLLFPDGTAIAESVAICRYFEEICPEPPLMGVDARDKAIVEMWNRRVELNLYNSGAAVFRHLHPAMAEMEKPQIPAWGEANRSRVLTQLEFLDRELQTRDYIAGDRFSIADISALCAVDFCKPAKIDVPEGLESLHRWHAMVSSRPSAKA